MSGRGYLIVVEGIDQSGKKTQSLLLEERMRREGWDVTAISFPDYSTPFGNEIKKFLAVATLTPLIRMALASVVMLWPLQSSVTLFEPAPLMKIAVPPHTISESSTVFPVKSVPQAGV